jgi:hypothetical protein
MFYLVLEYYMIDEMMGYLGKYTARLPHFLWARFINDDYASGTQAQSGDLHGCIYMYICSGGASKEC